MDRGRPTKRRKSDATQYATKEDIADIYQIFEERRKWLEKLEDTCSIQFARIAQIQAELDQIRVAWTKKQPRSKRAPKI